MSPVVLQELPTGLAHVAGLSTPHSHIEKKIGFPVLFKASLIGGYLYSGAVPSVKQLSYFK